MADAVRNPTRLTDFDLGRGISYVGPGTTAVGVLLAFVFRFLARRPHAFLLKTEKKSAKPGCNVFFPYIYYPPYQFRRL